MILIQLILIVTLLLIGLNFIKSRHTSRTKAYKKILLLLSLPLGIIVVMFPDISDRAASLLGVGRGADLLLYGVAVVVIFQLFNNYIKDRENERKNVKLARKIAILESLLKKEKNR